MFGFKLRNILSYNENADRYKVKDLQTTRCIGKGAFSVVYEAINKKSKTKVALKRVFISDMTNDKARSDCINELFVLRLLNHPNVISYYGYSLKDGMLNIVMELAEMGDLTHLITDHINNEHLISESDIWTVVKQITDGLSYMHCNDIMHRDLKPANIFRKSDGTIKLGDLGMSKYFPFDSKSAYTVLGSPYYMSPERLMREKYYFSSDIWSLGCTIYELTALKQPFFLHVQSLDLLITKVTTGDYEPISPNTRSQQLANIIDRCLCLIPDNRPTAQEICAIASQMEKGYQTLL